MYFDLFVNIFWFRLLIGRIYYWEVFKKLFVIYYLNYFNIWKLIIKLNYVDKNMENVLNYVFLIYIIILIDFIINLLVNYFIINYNLFVRLFLIKNYFC